MLIGRDREIAAIDELLAAPRGRALALLGEPGVGKTALLHAAAAHPEAGVVLRAGGVESEAQLPFAGLLDLVRPLLHLREALPAPQQAALAGALALGPPAPGDRFTVCVAVAELLARAGAERPHLVVVDDLPWLDAPSREAVLYVARRLPPGVALLLAARAGAAGDEAAALPPGLTALTVAPLADDAALALLRAGAPDLPADVARALVTAAAGLPLALLELPTALSPGQRSGADPVEEPLPAGPVVSAAFGGRVATLSPRARTALLALAAHGDRDLAPVARALAALGGDVAALEEAEAARCVVLSPGSAEFVHPLVRSVAYGHAAPADRRRVHVALADALGDDRAPWHRAAAATHPCEEVAAALDTVATRAAARRAHATAAAALERAAALSEDRATRARRLLGSARAASRAGLLEPARRVLAALEALGPEPALRLRGAQLRGFLEAWDGDAGDGGELLARSAAEIADAHPAAGAAMLADASLVATVAGDCRAALDRAETAAQLDALDRDLRVGAALSWALTLRNHGERARALVRRLAPALPALDPLSPDAQFLTIALNVRAPTEDYAAALADARRVAVAAREAGALAALPIALSVAADAAYRLGRWDVAHADATELLSVADATGQRMPLVHALGVLARLRAARGDAAGARTAGERAVAIGMPSRIGSMTMFAVAARGFLELGRGDVAAALRPLEECERMAEVSGLEEPLLVPWAPDLVEAYVRAGRRGDAARPLGRLQAAAAASGTATARALAARCRGLVAEDAGDVHFLAALRAHADAETPFERARTQLAYGTRLVRDGRRREARAQLHDARACFEALGAAPWAARATAELRAARGRRRARSVGLTPAEERVARAVARGLSNRDAAAELFLSPKTVEYHLRQSFAKLGVTNRTQLALALREREPA